MTTPSTPDMHERYRRGMCVDCGENPYRFGRPRCPGCHKKVREMQDRALEIMASE